MTIHYLVIKEGGMKAAFFYDHRLARGRYGIVANRYNTQGVDEPDFPARPEGPPGVPIIDLWVFRLILLP